MDIALEKIKGDIANIKRFWFYRNKRFREWYEILVLLDLLESKGMETYVSNEPQTFYNMAHYLLTKGELSHNTPLENESALELDRRARVGRGCEYMWHLIDSNRIYGGNQSFVDELAFFLLVLGWSSTVSAFDRDTGTMQAQVWNPYETYPKYGNNKMVACVHSYKLSNEDALLKAQENYWKYTKTMAPSAEVFLDDYFVQDSEGLHNMILISSEDVTGWVDRPDMNLLVSPVGGFPDRGSLAPSRRDWAKWAGRGIFEVNDAVGKHFNKWKSMMTQILRDTAQPIVQEFSASPQATPEQLRQRGALFHYAPGEAGLQRVPPAAIPIELQAHQLETRRELQKGSFNDATFGMVEGQPGYALSLLATSSANQILYPYMDGKHFVISEHDKFWLSKLKSSGRVFEVKGKFLEKLKPTDIPEGVSIEVDSDVATPKDWLERGTIANMADKHLDEATIITEIYGFSDPQAIKRRRSLDRMLNHPMSQEAELIAGFYAHADYLNSRGDRRQAGIFRRMAQAAEGRIGAPAPGQGQPEDMSRIMAAREAGAPEEKARVASKVAPPEARGFPPEQLRRSIGRGSLKAV